MKHIYYILGAILLLSSCTASKQEKPAGFKIEVKNVLSTKAKVVIEPSNPNVYYSYGIISEDMEEYFNMTDDENAQFQMDFSIERWEFASSDIAPSLTFSDIYCYKGRQEIQYTYLAPEKVYRVIAFQVDPDKKQYVGIPCSKEFRTNPLVKSSITFEFTFEPDKVTVTPSNNDRYYWDYIETEEMLEDYADPEQYYTQLILFYEEYGFMDLPETTDTGVSEWVFSEEDPGYMKEGGRYTITAAGYDNGEINSDITIIEFIYHKDIPCELVTPQE